MERPKHPRFGGVIKILRFNWPWYAGALLGSAAALLLLRSGLLSGRPAWLITALLALGNFWILSSLAVSHLVYDRSGLQDGAWLNGLEGMAIHRIAAFHAGQDEASTLLAERFPEAQRATYDIYDPAKAATDSLRRARALAHGDGAQRVDPAALPLAEAELDLACLVFSAHEIRGHRDRVAFFLQLRRALRTGGRVVLVEHLRDGWNGLAYGPNVVHFLSRAAWTSAITVAGLRIVHERPCTPFVRIFHLEPLP